MLVKGVIFSNRIAFDGVQEAVYNHFKAKHPNNPATKWSDGIDSTNSSEVLMLLDERTTDFPFSPQQIVDIDTNDTKWFIQDAL